LLLLLLLPFGFCMPCAVLSAPAAAPRRAASRAAAAARDDDVPLREWRVLPRRLARGMVALTRLDDADDAAAAAAAAAAGSDDEDGEVPGAIDPGDGTTPAAALSMQSRDSSARSSAGTALRASWWMRCDL
jgi:hypothetical protein